MCLAAAERDQMIEWYSPLNMFLRQADILSTWQPGTGRWFLERDSFQEWKIGVGKTLWCQGMPGAGKTVLTWVIITDTLRAEAELSQNIGVAVIYLNHKEIDLLSPSKLLAGVWRQLVFTKPLSPVMEQFYRKHREPRTRPTIDQDHAGIYSTISEYSKVFILVDGLDEYPEKQRDILLRQLGVLGPNVNLLLTSRPHIIIDHIIPNYETLEIRATEDDIRTYLDGQISKSSRLSKHVTNSPNLHEELEARVVQHSDGMFLLAKLHLDSLTEKRTVKEVRKALNNMAGDLDMAYDEVVDRINQQSEGDKKLAWRTLSWIIHAKRPLRRAELREALAVEPGATELDPENLPDMDIVLSVCAGLVVVNEEDDKIRLIHYSTELYLQSAHVQAREFPRAQCEITLTCITYLSSVFEANSHRLQQPLVLFADSPLLHYAVDYCLVHARGHAKIVELLIKLLIKRGANIDAQGWNNPLYTASEWGHDKVVKLLIQGGSRVNGGGWYRPLHVASVWGHEKVVKLLIESGAHINTSGLLDYSPLHAATEYGHTEVVRLLIERGANVNLQSQWGTALHQARHNGHQQIARLLAQHGAVDMGPLLRDYNVPDPWRCRLPIEMCRYGRRFEFSCV
ncbi:hypothetical protein DFH08DRAFT_701947 [Mycena albidolilacea]|uniref:NACHT domain-containing protein n=1 Tax=Mycena albidolilacea TaxID=1033008 RepID=A0AAD6ZYA4_9AGAR|nr:hypothetical protein DFH08DRAFT_701947 [Mycena albidolilacea]